MQMENIGQKFDPSKLENEEIIVASELGISTGALSSYQNKEVTFQASVGEVIEIIVTKVTIYFGFAAKKWSIQLINV